MASAKSVIADIIIQNGNLSSDKLYEENEILVNDIYLHSVLGGCWEEIFNYTSELYAVATQCPLTGGPAVYRARSLYYLIDNQFRFQDDETCSDVATEMRKAKLAIVSSVHVFPNPATGKATVLYNIQNEKGELILLDALGRTVKKFDLNSEQTRFEFDVSAFPNGIYQYYLTGNSVPSIGKLIIIR